ncbi:hypothetical protein TSUD_199280 [Trifolium subterraneum]|uniref:Cytochrome b/b6 N-terminal region profile domain-containing protein n=1 Tax=Trifolium subterraneum TaxID=3900 RepID=A0A2Z6MLY9_TRISU|nr:hypothetical protein TSUD_199280 [Trifolium subterraneum]
MSLLDSPVEIRENSIQFSMETEFCEFSPELEDHFEIFEHIRGFNVTIVTSANTQYETLPPWSGFLQKDEGETHNISRSFDGHKEIVLVATAKPIKQGLAPSAAGPQANVEHVMRDVEGGWLLRYMHANGATFTGYVPPWGQMSFWGATVITSLASAIPVVGDTIVTWLWGGFSVDNATLNRWIGCQPVEAPFVTIGQIPPCVFFLFFAITPIPGRVGRGIPNSYTDETDQ